VSFLDQLKYDANGLVAVVFQQAENGEVLTVAWANREALSLMMETGKAHVYRRSHGKVMMKGETSGHVQIVKELHVDCDADAVVIKVEQLGPNGSRGAACHTGMRSCFHRRVEADGSLTTVGEQVFDPQDVYGGTAQ